MDREYENFYEWVRKTLGLDLKFYKQRQLQRRINTVMEKSGARNLKEYALILEENKEKRDAFLDYITINVTEFYRNRSIFEDFEKAFMEEVVSRYSSYKIWSAACSVGAEPYTLAMILDKNNLLDRSEIIATDIDDIVLKKAKAGVYEDRYLKEVTKQEKLKYFDSVGDKYIINDKVKKIVSFKKHDLIVDNYDEKLNAIICRNVIIYFKDEAKNNIYRKMSDALLPKGLLFTGATESIYNPSEYGLKKIETFIYQKVD